MEPGRQYLITIGGCVGIDGMVDIVIGNCNGNVVVKAIMGIHGHVHYVPHCVVSTIRDLRNSIITIGREVKGVFGRTPLLNVVEMVAIDQDGITTKQLIQVVRL
jgi:hypothetical protein